MPVFWLPAKHGRGEEGGGGGGPISAEIYRCINRIHHAIASKGRGGVDDKKHKKVKNENISAKGEKRAVTVGDDLQTG